MLGNIISFFAKVTEFENMVRELKEQEINNSYDDQTYNRSYILLNNEIVLSVFAIQTLSECIKGLNL